DRVSDFLDRWRLRLPDSRMRGRLPRREMQEESGKARHPTSAAAVGKVDPDLGSERALVFRESDVAVDPGDGAAEGPRVGDQVLTHGLELGARIRHEANGGSLHDLLVAALVLRKPLAVVVRRQVLQESEGRWSEVGRFVRTHGDSPTPDEPSTLEHRGERPGIEHDADRG